MLADGKIYVGTENGKFFIVRPRADTRRDPERSRAADQHETALRVRRRRRSSVSAARRSRAAASSSSRATRVYAIGPKAAKPLTGFAVDEPAAEGRGRAGARAGRADRAGAEARPDRQAARRGCSTARDGSCATRHGDVVARGLKGTVDRRRVHGRAGDAVEQAGLIKATVGAHHGRGARARRAAAAVDRDVRGVSPTARCRRAGSTLTTGTVRRSATLDGQKVLQKAPDDTLFKRSARSSGRSTGRTTRSRPTCAAPTRRRQMGDIGITAQRYSLVLYGNVAASSRSSRGSRRRRGRSRCRSRGSRTPGIT